MGDRRRSESLRFQAHFVSGLMESGVNFTAVDFPQSNRLTGGNDSF
jgi:hypothetical protein